MIPLRLALVAAVLSPLALQPVAAQASSLAAVNQALQPCLAGGQPRSCPAALRALDQLQASSAYGRADRLCRQQVGAFKDVVALMAIRDTTPLEAQASFDAMAQSCAGAGL